MALNISKRTRTIMGAVLFIPIIGSFLIWGIGDMVKAAGVASYAATVGNVTISATEFGRAYEQQIDGMRRQGMQITKETAKQFGMGRGVLRSLIERELLLQGARDMGIVINDDVIAAEIQKERAFYDETGKFNREKFKQLLQNAQVTEEAFIAGLRGDLSIRLLVGAIQGAAAPPIALPRAMVMLQNAKYDADVYTINHDSLKSDAQPSDADLQKFYDTKKQAYQRPEMRRATLATLDVKAWQAKLQPPAEDLKKLYDARAAELAVPEERSAQFVILPDEAKARAAAERARGGEKLAAAASAVAGSPVELKKMESVKAGTLPAGLNDAVFKLPRAETSEPVQTSLGWYVIQITNIKAGIVPPMEKIKDKIVDAWRSEQASQQLPKLLNALDDGIAGGAALEELAKQHGMSLRQLPLLDAEGKGLDDTSVDKGFKEVLAAAFKQNQSEIGNVFETAEGNYAVLRVDEVRPATIPTLDEIKDKVLADWRRENAAQLAEKSSRELANSLRADKDAKAAAEKIGAKISVRSDISRANSQEGMKTTAIDRAIMRAGMVGDVVTATDGKAEYVAKVRAIQMPDGQAVTGAAMAEMQNLATEWVANDYMQLYLSALEQRHRVEINTKVIDMVEGK